MSSQNLEATPEHHLDMAPKQELNVKLRQHTSVTRILKYTYNMKLDYLPIAQ